MPPAEIQALLQARPFVPFRIVTATRSYEMRHPEFVMVGLATLIVATPDANNPTLSSGYHIVSLRHITHLEPEVQPST